MILMFAMEEELFIALRPLPPLSTEPVTVENY
jgi:hypothetical protein